MKAGNRILLTVFALLGFGAAAAQDFNLVAKVNGVGITRERLQSRVDTSMEDNGMNYGGITRPHQYREMQRSALDLLIAQELLWQNAEQDGYDASPYEVDAAFEEVRRDFPSERAMSAHLARNAMTEESLKEDLRRRISIRKWAYESLGESIMISDAEVHDFYVTNQVHFVRPEEVNVRHVLIKLAPSADDDAIAAARDRMDAILRKAQAGADFAELAREYSEGPSAADGGELGFAPRGVFVQPFEDAAFALQAGEISGITRTGYGFHIIKLLDRRDGSALPESEVAPAIRERLFEDRLLEAMAAQVKGLRQQASIEILIPL